MKFLQVFLFTILFCIPLYVSAKEKIVEVRDLVIFTATWCGPCVEIKKIINTDEDIKDVIVEYNSVIYIDIDRYPQHKIGYGIKEIPQMVVLGYINDKNSIVLDRLTGKRGLLQFLKKNSPMRKMQQKD